MRFSVDIGERMFDVTVYEDKSGSCPGWTAKMKNLKTRYKRELICGADSMEAAAVTAWVMLADRYGTPSTPIPEPTEDGRTSKFDRERLMADMRTYNEFIDKLMAGDISEDWT